MRILILRHGEPDYAKDCLTETGIAQAKLLAERLAGEDIRDFYVSPMGRARETCAATLEKYPGKQAEVCEWLHEFDLMWENPDSGKKEMVWDVPPDYWTEIPEFYQKEGWYQHPAMKAAGMGERIQGVNAGADAVLAKYGLIRNGRHYEVKQKCDDTIAMFCHFGAMCAVTAHLLNISPMIVWQGFNADFTAVTELCTDDRYGDKANFRICTFNDTHHLKEYERTQLKAK
ncbi:MAG: histidine phosphatase family protein [Ruminococcus sp.]|uniref:histidine phosphatase family protein n=1 Tax=Ruminococcus sp. TaxID=41978 RepID=UPI0025EBDB2D|nr:histidine phosphatase family protein [Ruminococcus sp.]MBO4866643.1 histidine phosphatase family protein [Ruminococcus sp.]